MAGTYEGGLKAAQKILERDPNHFKRIGAIGGSRGTTGGFYADRELARIAGAKGGKVSKRTKGKKADELTPKVQAEF
jgi:uncharacterized protein